MSSRMTLSVLLAWLATFKIQICTCAPALQEALRLREKKLVEEVLAVSLGPKQCQVFTHLMRCC